MPARLHQLHRARALTQTRLGGLVQKWDSSFLRRYSTAMILSDCERRQSKAAGAFRRESQGLRYTAVPMGGVVAATSMIVGLHWDVSWHRPIGRNTFWSAPHMALYFSCFLIAVSCGYLILYTTFCKPESRTSVSVWVSRSHRRFYRCLGLRRSSLLLMRSW
jgi:hypothetical protein